MATMSARYTVIDGEVVAQERSGVRHQLVPDPLGSVVALYDGSGTKTDTFEYWPYGESAARTGTTVAKFQYVGSYGYYSDSSTNAYVRARYYRNSLTSWVSEDELWNVSSSKYSYSFSSPITYIDIDGNFPVIVIKLPNPKKPPSIGWYMPPQTTCPLNPLDLLMIPCILTQKRIADNLGAQLPGWHNGPGDALKHCVGSCRILKECPSAYNSAVIGHEQDNAHWLDRPSLDFIRVPLLPPPFPSVPLPKPGWGHPHNWDFVEGRMDLFNDDRGKYCAEKATFSADDCTNCCMRALRKGYLYWLPIGTPGHPWGGR